ncbi:metal ABC transporter solute-binding protein, Zn/Mn family [Homoserinimonas sp. A520]
MRSRTKTGIALTALLTAASLAACTAQPAPADDGAISVVASTNVYGNIAEIIGGDLIEVTSIIDDPSQDPHSFEADARTQLTLSKADIVIENGGGYDGFVDQLLSSLGDSDRVVLSAVELSPLELEGGDEHAEEEEEGHEGHGHGAFNEHVWYHFATVRAVAIAVQDALASIDPANADRYESNAALLVDELDALGERAAAIHSAHDGTGVAITEPVPLYLLEAAGLHNVTPADFSEAIEGGSEVSAATLNETLKLFSTGEALLLVYNDQTTSPETEALLAQAEGAGVPIIPVTELLPEGTDYIGWMNGNLDSLESALGTP